MEAKQHLTKALDWTIQTYNKAPDLKEFPEKASTILSELEVIEKEIANLKVNALYLKAARVLEKTQNFSKALEQW